MEKDVDLKDLCNADRIRQLLEEIKNGTDHYVLKDNGQPVGALTSLSDIELLKSTKANREKVWDSLFAHLDERHARNPDISEEQVHADVEEAIRAVRQQAD